ncbi:hypothetical protein LNU06_03125 [Campylobacter sp. VicNov18]|uniref:hypothetical protein n=1 Tax=Campylobacter bilis TaxID=2691918 RepID=UPI00130E174E|nr:hypothetical protein [Campylobacter bilis]MPV63134.1 hypothetical protein [Campylobacter hepaticus]MBM0636634.1 hypothetical protein [Campylobacter bilis]MCC8277478.1 hypothetical protein [Campylobacter bilis]MCC8298683.1 hypothetical protein [Campylobacter bilis]MCC8300387.1 hypothetical protein [Campylobacter bilis]
MKSMNNIKMIKNTNAVINELMNKSHYKPLKTLFFCKDFLSSFPLAKQKLIARIYVKNHILNIIALHSAAYQELNHDDSKIYIKFLIKAYGQKYPLSGFSNIKEVKIFSQKYTSAMHKNTQNAKMLQEAYLELSNGNFKNAFKKTHLAQKFEELRQIIKKAEFCLKIL